MYEMGLGFKRFVFFNMFFFILGVQGSIVLL